MRLPALVGSASSRRIGDATLFGIHVNAGPKVGAEHTLHRHLRPEGGVGDLLGSRRGPLGRADPQILKSDLASDAVPPQECGRSDHPDNTTQTVRSVSTTPFARAPSLVFGRWFRAAERHPESAAPRAGPVREARYRGCRRRPSGWCRGGCPLRVAAIEQAVHGPQELGHRNPTVAVHVEARTRSEWRRTQGDVHPDDHLGHRNDPVGVAITNTGRGWRVRGGGRRRRGRTLLYDAHRRTPAGRRSQ